MREIQKADPEARRRAVILIGVAAIVGTGAIFLLERYRGDLEVYLERNADYLVAHPEILALGLFILLLPIIFFSLYLWRHGSSVVVARRFPPPGMAVTRDTPVLSGMAGVRRGRIIQVLALLLMSCSVGLPLFLWYVLSQLTDAV